MEQITRAEQFDQKRTYWKQHLKKLVRDGFNPDRILPTKQPQTPPAGLLEKAFFEDQNVSILCGTQIRGFAGYLPPAATYAIMSGNQRSLQN